MNSPESCKDCADQPIGEDPLCDDHRIEKQIERQRRNLMIARDAALNILNRRKQEKIAANKVEIPPHSYIGIAHEAAKFINCDGEWVNGTCIEVCDDGGYDYCPSCRFIWRLESFEQEATDWWNELGELDG